MSRWTATLTLAGFDRGAAEALAVTDRDAMLKVGAWSSTEDNHWRAVLNRLDWLNHPQVL